MGKLPPSGDLLAHGGVGRGCGVGRGLGVARGVAVGVTLGVGVTVTVAVGVAVGVGVGVDGQLPLTLNTMCISGNPMSAVGVGSVIPQSTELM